MGFKQSDLFIYPALQKGEIHIAFGSNKVYLYDHDLISERISLNNLPKLLEKLANGEYDVS